MSFSVALKWARNLGQIAQTRIIIVIKIFQDLSNPTDLSLYIMELIKDTFIAQKFEWNRFYDETKISSTRNALVRSIITFQQLYPLPVLPIDRLPQSIGPQVKVNQRDYGASCSSERGFTTIILPLSK